MRGDEPRRTYAAALKTGRHTNLGILVGLFADAILVVCNTEIFGSGSSRSRRDFRCFPMGSKLLASSAT